MGFYLSASRFAFCVSAVVINWKIVRMCNTIVLLCHSSYLFIFVWFCFVLAFLCAVEKVTTKAHKTHEKKTKQNKTNVSEEVVMGLCQFHRCSSSQMNENDIKFDA